jgi:tetratricopeptide (TPR) repeat protein
VAGLAKTLAWVVLRLTRTHAGIARVQFFAGRFHSTYNANHFPTSEIPDMRSFASVCLWVFLTITVTACNNKTPGPVASAPSPETAPAVAKIIPALTDEECIDFGSKLEKTFHNDRDAAARMLDMDAVVSRAVDGVDLSPKGLTNLRRVIDRMSSSTFEQVAVRVNQGGSYRFLRFHRESGQPHVLFRLDASDQGINYHDFLLARQADGTICAVDLYVFLKGEYLSQTVRRILLPTAVAEHRGVLDAFSGRDQVLIKFDHQLDRMSSALVEGKYDEILQLFDQLPASLQNEKRFRLTQLQATSRVSEDKFNEAMEQYRTLFPGDPSCDLVLIDHSFLKKQFEGALRAIDALDKAVGGDPHLDVLRAKAHAELGNATRAKQCLHKAIDGEPTLKSAYWSLVDISLEEKDHAETARLLNELSDRFNVLFKDLTKQESYKDFVKSPQYREWLNARNGK